MFILDTDHLGIIQRQNGVEFERLRQRLQQHDESAFFVTIVSFHEQIQGWQAYIARAKKEESVSHGYTRLEGILSDFSLAQVSSHTRRLQLTCSTSCGRNAFESERWTCGSMPLHWPTG